MRVRILRYLIAAAALMIMIGPIHADRVATIDVNGSLTSGGGPILASVPDNGPDFYVTGVFTFDETTDTILSYTLGMLGPAGTSATLVNGTSFGSCDQCIVYPPFPSGAPGLEGWWVFDFS